MDTSLKCNSLSCRTKLNDRAVVTTCSHIFCVPCSESLEGLAKSKESDRVCPACKTQLVNPDDAVVTQLNPTEDYKTSVLSGLSPSIIMECAGRGLSFHSYQTSQEMLYQDFLARNLKEKNATLSSQMDGIINQANGEINKLQEKLQAMHMEQKDLEQKNHDLQQRYREKARGQHQLQKMYNKLKQQQVAGGLEIAAENEAQGAVHAVGIGGAPFHSRAGSGHSGHSGARRQTKFNVWEQQQYGDGSRAGLQSARSAPQVPPTPSNHRTRLPAHGAHGSNYPAVADNFRQGTPYRQPLQTLDPNIYNNFDGYRGMSNGLKFGKQQNEPMSRSGFGVGSPGGVSGLHLR